MIRFVSFIFFSALCLHDGTAAEQPVIRLGTMAAGTLAWELAAMRNLGLADGPDFKLEAVTLANQQAGKIALQSGSADVIVSDWIWVSGMRAAGEALSFYPYSTTAGGLLAAKGSDISGPAGLKGKKLGIAGGELDKNWLLLQSLGLRQGINLGRTVEKVYGAPALLNQQLANGRLDALLTYWQFAATLQAKGFRQLMSGEDIIRNLGIATVVPSLGYVFKENWAQQNRAALKAFFRAAQTARNALCENDGDWQAVVGLTGADAETQPVLRSRYCQGRVVQWGEANRAAASEIYELLHGLKGNKLTANSPHLQAGVFWPAD